MSTEIHRHFVLCKRSGHDGTMVYRQIILVEHDQFELRVFDCETLDLNPTALANIGLGEPQLYDNLASGILGAEKEHRLSVKTGWRALDSTVPAFAALKPRRAAA